VIENRGGAGGMIGTEATAKSAPDGYTFLITPNATLTILPGLRQAPYDAMKSFDPVGRVGDLVSGFVIHPAVGVKTFKELIEYAKKNPGKLAYGSAGLGTATQLRIEMLKYRAGIDILHVPYRGSADALNDLLPNTVQMMNEINVLPHVKAGKLILLDVNYATRHPDFPDVPTLTELGFPDSDVPIWYLMLAPAGTPKEIVQKLNAKLVEIAKSEEMIAKMRAINVIVPPQTPEEVRAYLVEDTKRNAELIKAANIKLE
jgi:tripartite-type tricarboxylate transporter receptor subunit TctC